MRELVVDLDLRVDRFVGKSRQAVDVVAARQIPDPHDGHEAQLVLHGLFGIDHRHVALAVRHLPRHEPGFRRRAPFAHEPVLRGQVVVGDGVADGFQRLAVDLVFLRDGFQCVRRLRLPRGCQHVGVEHLEEHALAEHLEVYRRAAHAAARGGVDHDLVDARLAQHLGQHRARCRVFQFDGREVAFGKQQRHGIIDDDAAQVGAHARTPLAQRYVFAVAAALVMERMFQAVVERPAQHALQALQAKCALGIVAVERVGFFQGLVHCLGMWGGTKIFLVRSSQPGVASACTSNRPTH